MLRTVRFLPLGALLLHLPTWAAEPMTGTKESAAVQAAQARLDAAANELAEIVAREHPGSPAPMKIELRVARDGDLSPGPGGPATDVRMERRVVLAGPDDIRMGDPRPLVQLYEHEMHGPIPDDLRRRPAFPDLELASLSPALGKYFGASSGVLVVRAGHAAGLQDGDVITQIGQRAVDTAERARAILDTYGPGEPAPVTLYRERRPLDLKVPVEATRVPSDR